MVLIHQNLKYLQVYKYDIPFGPGTQATCFFGGLFKWVLRTFLSTEVSQIKGSFYSFAIAG